MRSPEANTCLLYTSGRWIEETIAEPLGLTSLTVEGSPAYSGYAHAEDLMLFARELSHPTLISAEPVSYTHLGRSPSPRNLCLLADPWSLVHGCA